MSTNKRTSRRDRGGFIVNVMCMKCTSFHFSLFLLFQDYRLICIDRVLRVVMNRLGMVVLKLKSSNYR